MYQNISLCPALKVHYNTQLYEFNHSSLAVLQYSFIFHVVEENNNKCSKLPNTAKMLIGNQIEP